MEEHLILLSFFVLFSCEKESEQSDFINDTKKKYSRLSSAWNSVKRTAKEVWKEIKPVITTDAKGAAGAMFGLIGYYRRCSECFHRTICEVSRKMYICKVLGGQKR